MNSADLPVQILTRARPGDALAAALTYMAGREPFRSAPLHEMVRTVSAAIKRGHYGFTLRNGKVCGFACYAITTEAVVRAWGETGIPPESSDGAEGDVVMMLQASFDDAAATVAGLRHLAWLYPGYRYAQRRSHRKHLSWGRFPQRRSDVDVSAVQGSTLG